MAHNNRNTDIKEQLRQGVEIETIFIFVALLLRDSLQTLLPHQWGDDSDSKYVTGSNVHSNMMFYLIAEDNCSTPMCLNAREKDVLFH
jgi:hypothetical protein